MALTRSSFFLLKHRAGAYSARAILVHAAGRPGSLRTQWLQPSKNLRQTGVRILVPELGQSSICGFCTFSQGSPSTVQAKTIFSRTQALIRPRRKSKSTARSFPSRYTARNGTFSLHVNAPACISVRPMRPSVSRNISGHGS